MTKSRPGFLPRDYDWHPQALTPAYKSSRLRSPSKPLVMLPDATTEMHGPVFGQENIGETDNDLVHNFAQPGESAIGPRIQVHGRVLDEFGHPVQNTLVEIWQANSGGRYRHKNDTYLAPLDKNFSGCGRTMTDEDGTYQFFTIQPGAYPWPNHENAWRPMHIHFSVFGPAFAQRLITQMYFEGDPLIPLCPIVQGINDQKAIDQLTAKLDMECAISMDRLAYQFNVVLRGRNSTVFENKLEGN
ncbi:MAG: protocatechuate 3,4-dioxygenase subunit beta [Pseudomonadota bacterium]